MTPRRWKWACALLAAIAGINGWRAHHTALDATPELAATSGRLILLTRKLLGGFDVSDIRWQDLEEGRGVAVLDPHGDLVDEIVGRVPEERQGEVILFDPADTEHPIAWNLLEAHTELERWSCPVLVDTS